eukprot:CAMPEP_0115216826 /NCGR_PEP_ID=MMETSP0270-20121206/25540_1 /TAXON_ID=71861 /ORGANISM="Scrippsiella trochoidea, Strain CCMP3099" /LENGTH=556 /DNA_ID=CAMNT_0002630679 /DNA_START=44 /DNA_END=1714 /DNA_ORIENTATION=-
MALRRCIARCCCCATDDDRQERLLHAGGAVTDGAQNSSQMLVLPASAEVVSSVATTECPAGLPTGGRVTDGAQNSSQMPASAASADVVSKVATTECPAALPTGGGVTEGAQNGSQTPVLASSAEVVSSVATTECPAALPIDKGVTEGAQNGSQTPVLAPSADVVSSSTSTECKVPWKKPSREDRNEWGEVCPEGGGLIRLQTCVAQLEDDWSMGRLFISELGILFDDGISGVLRTALVRWKDMQNLYIEHEDGANDDKLVLTSSVLPHPQVLRLFPTLSTSSWLCEMWAIQTKDQHGIPTVSFTGVTGTEDGEHQDVEASVQSRSFQQSRSLIESFKRANTQDADQSVPPQTSFKQTPSFVQAAARLPDPSTLDNRELIFDETLNTQLANVRAKLESEEWPIHEALRQGLQASEISASPWGHSRQRPGSWVRRSRFVLPSPLDLPDFVTKLVTLTEPMRVTCVSRLQCTDEEIVLVQQSCATGILFADLMSVNQVLVFRPRGQSEGAGVVFQKFEWVEWVKSFSNHYGPLKAYIERQAKTRSEQTAKALYRILGEA